MKQCIACKGRLFDIPLMTLNHMPASAQNIPGENELGSEQEISLKLWQCRDCGLVQFDCEPVPYYREVIRAGGISTTMTLLRHRQYRHLIEHYSLERKKFIEIGCGGGEFLAELKEYPVRACGIEYRDDLVAQAKKKGLDVWKAFAGSHDVRLGDPRNPENSPPFDVFLSFNFLEHQPDPSGMLEAIYENLAEEGMGLITVPSFEYILEQDSYYELIPDHLAYYTFDSLRILLERNGFRILEQQLINRDTIEVIVKKIPERISIGSIQERPVDVSGLKKTRDLLGQEINQWIDELTGQNKKVAIWGASHQGFTLAATTGLRDKVQYIIDSAPFKQGLYAPASHIPIVSPEHFQMEPVDAVLIVAPGYTDEITAIIRERFIKPQRPVEILALRSNHLEWQ